MTRCIKKSSKTELERSTIEMIKAAKRLASIKKGDPLWAGIYKETHKRLVMLEKQIKKHSKKSSSEFRIHEIAKETAKLIGHLCKSLIRYTYHCRMKICNFVFSLRSVNI